MVGDPNAIVALDSCIWTRGRRPAGNPTTIDEAVWRLMLPLPHGVECRVAPKGTEAVAEHRLVTIGPTEARRDGGESCSGGPGKGGWSLDV